MAQRLREAEQKPRWEGEGSSPGKGSCGVLSAAGQRAGLDGVEGPVRRPFYGPVPRGHSLWGHFHHHTAAANAIPSEVSDHRRLWANKDLSHRLTNMGPSLSA